MGLAELFLFVSVLVELENIKRSNLCFAGGIDLEGEVSGVISLVRGLMENVGPSDEFVNNCSPFYKLCVKRMENFVVTAVPNGKISQGKLRFDKEPSMISGRKALCYLFDKFQTDYEKGVKKELVDMQPFRTFGWALSPPQKTLTASWLSVLLKNHMSKFKTLKDASSEFPTGGDGVYQASGREFLGKSSSSASSSSDQGIIVPASSVMAQASDITSKMFGKTDKVKKNMEQVDVFKFFAGKA